MLKRWLPAALLAFGVYSIAAAAGPEKAADVPAALPPALAAPSLAAPAAPILDAAAVPEPAAPPAASLAAPAAPAQAEVSRQVQGLQAVAAQAAAPRAESAPVEDGAASAARAFDALTWERPRFSAEELAEVAKANAALSSAVGRAASQLLPAGSFEVQQRGSTARGTHTSSRPDYDLTVYLHDSGHYKDVDHFIAANHDRIRHALQETIQNRAQSLFPGQAVHVAMKGPAPIYNVFGHENEAGVFLFSAKVLSGDQDLLLDVDVIFTDRPDFANAYPAYFARQLDQIKQRGGQEAVESTLGDIRLLKKVFAQGLNAPKTYKGGIGGVGAEQLLMQSGRVSDADHGQTILEPGSFDALMRRVLSLSHDAHGRPRRMDEVRSLWKVHNPFMEPSNFLLFLRQDKWDHLVKFAKNYLAVQANGRPVTLDAVASGRVDKSFTRDLGRDTLALLDRFMTSGPKAVDRGDAYLYAEGAKAVPPELTQAWSRWLDGKRTAGKIALFERKGTRSFLWTEAATKEGVRRERQEIPPSLGEGLPSQSLVDVTYSRSERKPIALKALGTYPVDMIVGRVVQRDGGLRVGALFWQDGRALSVYRPLPIDRGVPVKAGDIVQAYVRPQNGGFVATPLIGLGREITPEIASREIALRHGARGYFDADVIKQAEDVLKNYDAAKEFEQLKAAGRRVEDLSALPFVTIDPPGAADLDDAFYVRREADGGYTWYLATALVAPYVKPGTPAFRAAARLGNTFYTIDKDGVGAYPMNHPVISKYASSLLKGKKSLAMITEMRFGPDGSYDASKARRSIGLVDVKGRYTYDQVTALWKGAPDSGIEHADQISLARELARTLNERYGDRGKLQISLPEAEARRAADGSWELTAKIKDPVADESHRLIEELKVYGNLGLKARLQELKRQGVQHFNRTHPEKDESVNAKLQAELMRICVWWDEEKESLPDLLRRVNERDDLTPEQKETAGFTILLTRSRARYTVSDDEGHEGLAFEKGKYGHPSTPIRRFGDMDHNDVLFADLTGGDVKKEQAAILADFHSLGISGFEEFARHLNARQDAAAAMTRAIDDFMSVYELAKPKYHNRPLKGYVKATFGRNNSSEAIIAFKDSPAELKLRGERAAEFARFDTVEVTIHGADLERLTVKADVTLKERPFPQKNKKDERAGEGRGSRREVRRDSGPSSDEAVRLASSHVPNRDDKNGRRSRRQRRRDKRRRR